MSASSDEEEHLNEIIRESKKEDAVTPLSTLPEKTALKYLELKFSNRFTVQDPLFVEALERSNHPPPIVIDYTGKIQRRGLHAPRGGRGGAQGGFHNRRDDYNRREDHTRQRDYNRREEHDRGEDHNRQRDYNRQRW